MKRLCLIMLTGLLTSYSYAQIPPVPNPVCAFCGADIKTNEPHKPGCMYYTEPDRDEPAKSSSSSSAKSSSSSPRPNATTSSPTTTTSTKRKRIKFLCTDCNMSVLAYNIDEASQIFTNQPWVHSPSCPQYRPRQKGGELQVPRS